MSLENPALLPEEQLQHQQQQEQQQVRTQPVAMTVITQIASPTMNSQS